MPRPGVIFLQFRCVSQDYWVDSPNAPGLLLYVLDSSPDLANWLYGAINRAYRADPWSSPGDTPVRTLYAWLNESERYPELQHSPQREEILARLRDLRERMVQAYRNESYQIRFWPDVAPAIRHWRAQGHRVVSFSSEHSERRQRTIFDRAVPDEEVLPVVLSEDTSEASIRELLPLVPAGDPERALFVIGASGYPLAAEWRERRIRCVLLDRTYVVEPYLEPGYGLYIGALTTLNPDLELQRKYYRRGDRFVP